MIRFIAYILVLTAPWVRCRAGTRSRFCRGWSGLNFMNLASIGTFDTQAADETHILETLAQDRASMMASVRHKSFDPATNKRNFVLNIKFLVGNAVHSPGRYGKLLRLA